MITISTSVLTRSGVTLSASPVIIVNVRLDLEAEVAFCDLAYYKDAAAFTGGKSPLPVDDTVPRFIRLEYPGTLETTTVGTIETAVKDQLESMFFGVATLSVS